MTKLHRWSHQRRIMLLGLGLMTMLLFVGTAVAQEPDNGYKLFLPLITNGEGDVLEEGGTHIIVEDSVSVVDNRTQDVKNIPGVYCQYDLSGNVGQASAVITPSSLNVKIIDAEPNMVYTVWLDYRDRDNNKALPPDFPVDAQGVAPAFAMTAGATEGMGLDVNAIQTNAAGNGMITIPLDYNILAAYEGPLVHVDLDKQGANRVGGHWMRVYPKGDDVPASQVIDPSTGLPKIVRGSVRGFTIVKHPSGITHGHTPGTKDIDHFGGFSDNMPANCLGTSIIWAETFNELNNGTTQDTGDTAWTSTRNGYHQVYNGKFEINGPGNEAIWVSEVIDISKVEAARFSMELFSINDLEPNEDYIRVYYKLDGGPEHQLTDRVGDFMFGNHKNTVYSDPLSGKTLQIILKAYLNYPDEYYQWDNIVVSEASTGPYFSWVEHFEHPIGTTADQGVTQWKSARNGIYGVNDGTFRINGNGSEAIWVSDVIDISTVNAVDLSMAIRSYGPMETYQDYLRVYYKLDSGSEILIAERVGDFNNSQFEVVGIQGVSGDTVQFVVRSYVSYSNEYYRWDTAQIHESAESSSSRYKAKHNSNLPD